MNITIVVGSMPIFRFDVRVRMRDGVRLSTNILLPDGGGPFPTVLIRSPYNVHGMISFFKALVPRLGIAWVLQDARGRYNSGGETFRPFEEKLDTLDTIAWIQEQGWSDGDIHIFGPSYLGYVGLQVLGEAGVRTLFAPTTFSRPEEGLVYRDGVLHLHWALPWSIMTSGRVQAPLDNINGGWPDAFRQPLPQAVENLGWPDHVWRLFLTPPGDPLWDGFDALGGGPFRTRVALVGGWYDFMLGSTLSTYEHLKARGGVRPDLILGPWSHNGYLQSQAGLGGFEFGEEGRGNVLSDFSGFLQREKAGAPPLTRAFIMRANRWMDLPSWPPQTCEKRNFYLGADGGLSDEPPKEGPHELEFEADPEDPVPTLGGGVWEFKEPLTPGPADQRPLGDREDILRFHTQPLKEPLTLLGTLSTRLWVGAGAREAYFTAKLVLVEADGCRRIVHDGVAVVENAMREPHLIEIDMLAIGLEVGKGEAIGLEISWANFPKYALPPLHGKTRQSVFSSEDMPSHLSIPIMPRPGA